MRSISLLLEKFKNLTNHNLLAREAAREILEKEYLIKVSPDSIVLKGAALSVKVSGAAKAEIFLVQKDFIKKINQRLGKEVVSKII